jgi:hypothetical protein
MRTHDAVLHIRYSGGPMRRTATAVLVAVCLTLAGCGGNTDAAKSAAKPSPSPSVDKAGQFITASQGLPFTTMRPSNDELLAFPPKWCDGLDAGHSVAWLFDFTGGGGLYPVGENWGMVKSDANALLVAGVKAYCPENLDAVLEELRSSGEY